MRRRIAMFLTYIAVGVVSVLIVYALFGGALVWVAASIASVQWRLRVG